MLSIAADGAIYAFWEDKIFPGGSSDLDNLQKRLKQLRLISADFDHNTVVSGRYLVRKLQELVDTEIDELLTIYREYCG